MKQKHIFKELTEDHPSYTYIMTEKENTHIDILIKGSVSFSGEVNIHLNTIGGTAFVRCYLLPEHHAAIKLITHQMHNAPKTKSDLLVRSLVKDTSSVTYKGNVYIAKLAKGSDAYQKNENLVIGDGCVISSEPTLEILSNDVRCTHGVTTGSIPEDILWYLKTRGLTDIQAKELYVQGFIHDIISHIHE